MMEEFENLFIVGTAYGFLAIFYLKEKDSYCF